MSQIKRVVVTRGEGDSSHDYTPHIFRGIDPVEEAEKYLAEIAADAPATGGYYKTDVEVTLTDDTTIGLRMDVQRIGMADNDIEILPHLRSFLEAYSGTVVPEQYKDKHTPEQWLNLMVSRHGAESTMELARALKVLNG